jgi:hypothetical protein
MSVEDDKQCLAMDFVCNPLCTDNTYETGLCNYADYSQRQCTTCTECGVNQYQSYPCTANVNRECTVCTVITECEPGYTYVACTEFVDAHCGDCVLPDCGDNMFASGCSTTQDYECKPCSTEGITLNSCPKP